jgi:diadenosine tetraphosphate (Ap4A) HIT family hydrolase
MFTLDSRLEKDTVRIGNFSLCEVLLMNDSNFPWVILVPKREGITEIFELSPVDQRQLLTESVFVAQQMRQHFSADKMNVAALGNVVSQLHLHHIARYKDDAAWPRPVWGAVAAVPYSGEELVVAVELMEDLFSEMLE